MIRKKQLGILIGGAIISILLTGCGDEGSLTTSESAIEKVKQEEQIPTDDISNNKDVNAIKSKNDNNENIVKEENNSNSNKKDKNKSNNKEINNEKKNIPNKEVTNNNKKIIEESKKVSTDNKEKVQAVKEKIEENKSNNKEITNEKKDYIYDIIGCLDGTDNCYVAAQEICEDSCKKDIPLTPEQKKKVEYYMNNINEQWAELAKKTTPAGEKYAKVKSHILCAQKELQSAVKVYNQGIDSNEKVSENQDVAKGTLMIENSFNGILSQIGEEINNLEESNL